VIHESGLSTIDFQSQDHEYGEKGLVFLKRNSPHHTLKSSNKQIV